MPHVFRPIYVSSSGANLRKVSPWRWTINWFETFRAFFNKHYVEWHKQCTFVGVRFILTIAYVVNCIFYKFFHLLSVYFYCTWCTGKYTDSIIHIIIIYLLILRSVYWISCCPHADIILPKLPAVHKRPISPAPPWWLRITNWDKLYNTTKGFQFF